jgi:hypothetical protein
MQKPSCYAELGKKFYSDDMMSMKDPSWQYLSAPPQELGKTSWDKALLLSKGDRNLGMSQV